MTISVISLLTVLGCRKNTAPTTEKTVQQPAVHTLLEFDIHQNEDLILLTSFAEPPQFAIWLEDPETHQLKTIFVTYRSATGDLVGKHECPGCLPRWFEVFEQETGKVGYPTQDDPAPTAVTVPTPQDEHFKIRYEVKPGSKWICWLEMNLAGDFNEKYQEYDPEQKIIDWDFSGQPSLIYRTEITAIPGRQFIPELYGKAVLNSPTSQTVQPITDDITTAKDIFKSIKINVIQPEPAK
jgi:hypothetical protein